MMFTGEKSPDNAEHSPGDSNHRARTLLLMANLGVSAMKRASTLSAASPCTHTNHSLFTHCCGLPLHYYIAMRQMTRARVCALAAADSGRNWMAGEALMIMSVTASDLCS